ncbi:hypothetical protein ACFL3E_01315 [Patescibacteria group bacterium]
MTRLKRKLIFWALIIIFPIIALAIILYSFGFRLSIHEGGIVSTGGIFISSVPTTGAKIFLDDKFIKETTLIARSTFIQGLTPGKYKVRVERDNAYSWEKELTVMPEYITEARAFLFNTDPEGEMIERGDFTVINLWDDKTLELITSEDKSRFFDIETNSFLAITPEQNDEVVELAEENEERVLFQDDKNVWVEIKDNYLPYFTSAFQFKLMETPSSLRNIAFYPRRDAVIASYSNGIFVIELDGRGGGHNITPLYKGKEPNMVMPDPDERIIYILDDGNLIKLSIL